MLFHFFFNNLSVGPLSFIISVEIGSVQLRRKVSESTAFDSVADKSRPLQWDGRGLTSWTWYQAVSAPISSIPPLRISKERLPGSPAVSTSFCSFMAISGFPKQKTETLRSWISCLVSLIGLVHG